MWLDEIATPTILTHDRLGHSMPGIGGTYAHVSPFMRDQLRARLQARWEATLDERLAICPTSPVPLLNGLLAARRAAVATPHLQVIVSQPSPNRVGDRGRGVAEGVAPSGESR
ncbi:hypothetical protein E1287_02180 [Actinomadura sp. KC06]|uniref:hypothetical protein n=1 Tax=Actinomadura sp. KC06 TaxID=2530369 RepID=UPI00104C6499|nr:hypothetical protein [Actinomadura sp. KC06]TDD40000.1 hypothetical protein E1287_02180 [Actinomadura sp. KC06]